MAESEEELKSLLMEVKEESESCSSMSDSFWPHGLCSPWNIPGQNTGVGNLSLLQGIFLTRNQTGVSYITGRFFTNWAMREAPRRKQVSLFVGLNKSSHFSHVQVLLIKYFCFLHVEVICKQMEKQA